MSKVLPIISSYPPQDPFRKSLKKVNPTLLRVFVDLKNIQTGLYINDIVEEIVNRSETYNIVDCNMIQSLMAYCGWWKKFAKDMEIPCEIYISSDVGDSWYHKGINKKYKARRLQAQVLMPDYYDKLPEIRQKNELMGEVIFNKLPDIYYHYLKFLESDFMHYWLISRGLEKVEGAVNIICSNDKDMYQSLTLPRTVQFFKVRGKHSLVTQHNCMQFYCKSGKKSPKAQMKTENMIKKLNKEFIVAIMALVGDLSDDVPGIKGLGNMAALQLMTDEDFIEEYIGTPDELNDRVSNDESFFKKLDITDKYGKKCKEALENHQVVTDAYKMISFEMLSRWLESGNHTEKLKRTNYINDILSKKEIKPISDHAVFFETLQKQIPDFSLSENHVKNLF